MTSRVGWSSYWQRAVYRFASIRAVGMFVEDRLLLVAFLVLWVSALTPMFVTPILPLIDMGSNIGAAGLMNDAAFGHGVVAQHYFVNRHIIPYWTVYALMSALEALGGPFLAVKMTVGLSLALLPLGVMRLMQAFGRSPRLGLWAFLLCWDINLYWGWITFQIGMALALWALAMVYEARTWRDAVRVLVLTLVIALTHVHAVALTLLVGGLLAFIKRPFKKALLLHAVGLSGSVLMLAPWLLPKFFPRKDTPATGPLSFVTHTTSEKLGSWFHYALDLIPTKGVGIMTWAFLLLLFGPALLMLVRPRSISQPSRAAPALFFFGAAGLYLLMPFEIDRPVYHWWTYPRFGTYALIGLMLMPGPRLDGWRSLAVLPGVLCAFLVHHAVLKQFKEYGQYVRPYLQIIDALPRDKLFYPLDLDDYRFKGTYEAVLGQLHGYAAAAKSCFDPHLFDEANNPLRFRASNMPPVGNWSRPASFTMKSVGAHYDYIIVHPIDRDFISDRWRDQVQLVKEAGAWRLYRVLP